jgi:hypothetical protein
VPAGVLRKSHTVVFTVPPGRRLGPGHRVVTVQVDSGLKYLAGQLYA